MKQFLVVVDMQKDFVDGALGTPEAEAIIPASIEKIRNFDGDLFVTYDTHFEDYLSTAEGRKLPVPHCIYGTPGWELDNRIGADNNLEFGVIVFDLNELKQINDTHGHEEGDKYIYTGCMLICKIFAHSPVYRIGGDEFVVILEGSDYDNRDILINEFDRQISENERKGLVTISRGLDVYKPSQDSEYNHVFERADKKMYEYKAAYKSRKS